MLLRVGEEVGYADFLLAERSPSRVTTADFDRARGALLERGTRVGSRYDQSARVPGVRPRAAEVIAGAAHRALVVY